METNKELAEKRYRPLTRIGLGGVAIGNGLNVNSDVECYKTLEASWEAGMRYFDTSPLYGLGISEHRMGIFLAGKKREDYTLSSKVGRILLPHENFDFGDNIWKGKHNFGYRYDYTAAGTRKSVEDSLQRMGVSSLDIVFIHDISPENWEGKDQWLKYFEIAQKGAMPELEKMKQEGIIKAWGVGTNRVEPLLKTLEVADPDIFLAASQYSLIDHVKDLNSLFPKCAERNVSVVVGSPLDAGFLSGKNRYLYWGTFPPGVKEKLAAIEKVAANHQVDVRTAAIQFCAAPEVVSAVIPGAHTAEQTKANAVSFFETKIPAAFWEELKAKKLIAENAPLPTH